MSFSPFNLLNKTIILLNKSNSAVVIVGDVRFRQGFVAGTE